MMIKMLTNWTRNTSYAQRELIFISDPLFIINKKMYFAQSLYSLPFRNLGYCQQQKENVAAGWKTES